MRLRNVFAFTAAAGVVMVGCAAMPLGNGSGGGGGETTTSAPTTSIAVDGHCARPPEPGVDWSGCNLTGRHFTAVDLRGANLSGAILIDVVFEGGCYRWSGPCSSTMLGANINGAEVLRTDFGGVDMSWVSAQNVWFTRVAKMPARLRGADLTGARIENRNLGYIPISGTDPNGPGPYYSVDFIDARMIDAVLRGSSFGSTGTVPYGESLGARFVRANLTDADLTETRWTAWCNEAGTCSPAINFTGANFTETDLTGSVVHVRGWNLPSAGDPILTSVTWYETICSDGFEREGAMPCP